MAHPTDLAGDAGGRSHADGAAEGGSGPSRVGGLLGRVPRLGIWSWSFVGFVLASSIVVIALAAVSEIVLPMTFADGRSVLHPRRRPQPTQRRRSPSSSRSWPCDPGPWRVHG